MTGSVRDRPAHRGPTVPRLVFVDDDVHVLKAIERLFRFEPFHVQVFTDPDAALDNLFDRRAHVVVTDLKMPYMSGLSLLERAEEYDQDTVRIVLSAFADRDSLLGAINTGLVHRYIVKPWDAVELKAVVRQAIDLHELRAERRRLLAELEHHNRLLTEQVGQREQQLLAITRSAEIGRYASQIVHNLKVPIQSIGGAVAVARMALDSATPDTGQIDECLTVILDAARDVQNTVGSVIQHAHDSSLFAPVDVELSEVVREALRFFEFNPAFVAISEKTVNLAEDLPKIRGNHGHFRQIVDNLVKNAIDAMENTERKSIVIETYRESTSVVFAVDDSGTGIQYEHLDELFSPYFTTKPPGKGTGLGLASVKALVDSYGGQISVQTHVGLGSRFAVSLPVLSDAL